MRQRADKMDFEICRAENCDAQKIACLEKKYFSAPWSLSQIIYEINKENAVFLTAKTEDELVGYISGENIAGEFYVNNICVDAAFRRCGAAQGLLSELISHASCLSCAFITLEVRISNAAAISLYEKNGFKFLGERRNFYSAPPENAAIYTLYFDNTAEEL